MRARKERKENEQQRGSESGREVRRLREKKTRTIFTEIWITKFGHNSRRCSFFVLRPHGDEIIQYYICHAVISCIVAVLLVVSHGVWLLTVVIMKSNVTHLHQKTIPGIICTDSLTKCLYGIFYKKCLIYANNPLL